MLNVDGLDLMLCTGFDDCPLGRETKPNYSLQIHWNVLFMLYVGHVNSYDALVSFFD